MPPRTRIHSEMAAALNADVEALIPVKDSSTPAPTQVIFESVIRILGIVEVQVPPLPFSITIFDKPFRVRL